MPVHLERHLPMVVVGNNLHSLVLACAYDCPYIFVVDEFPVFGKGFLGRFEISILHALFFGGKLTKIMRKWNSKRHKLPYWNWLNLVSGIGGLDITNGKCREIRFDDPNTIFVLFEDGSTMKIYYDLCFLTTPEKIRLPWELHEKYDESGTTNVFDAFTVWGLRTEKNINLPKVFRKPRTSEDKKGVRKIFWPGTRSELICLTKATIKQLKNDEFSPGEVEKEVKQLISDSGLILKEKWGVVHKYRFEKQDILPFCFYPQEVFMFDHNKMVVNWRIDNLLEHVKEIIQNVPLEILPQWKKFVWMLKTNPRYWKNTVEFRRTVLY